METKKGALSKVLVAAAVAGLLSGVTASKAQADDHGKAKGKEKMEGEKHKCKGEGDKHTCKGDKKKKKKKKGEKDAAACGGPNGCGK